MSLFFLVALQGVGAPIRINSDHNGREQFQPCAEIDPTDPDHIVVLGTEYELGAVYSRAKFYVSWDGGTSWSSGSFPFDPFYAGEGGEDVTFDPDGTVHAFTYADSGFSVSSRVFRSYDGGMNWSGPTHTAHAFDLECDRTPGPYPGHLYAAGSYEESGYAEARFLRSLDGGDTYAIQSTSVSSPGYAEVALGPQGEVYFFFVDAGYVPNHLLLRRSFDGGASFDGPILIESLKILDQLSAASDSTGSPYHGRVYLTFSSGANPTFDVLMTSSDDQGATWSAPQTLNPVATGSRHFSPSVFVGPGGQVDVIYYTNEYSSGSTELWDVLQQRSCDGGASWDPPRRITPTSFPRPSAPLFLFRQADLTGDGNTLLPVWYDTRDGDSDLFTARVELNLLPSADAVSSAAPAPTAWALDAGPAFEARSYALLASGSGTTPGLSVNGTHIPLNRDAVFDKVLDQANSPPLADFQGTLDACGRAGATFAPPPNALAPLVGRDLYFAFVTHLTGVPDWSSNAVRLTVLP